VDPERLAADLRAALTRPLTPEELAQAQVRQDAYQARVARMPTPAPTDPVRSVIMVRRQATPPPD
jgi:hypothetical protein